MSTSFGYFTPSIRHAMPIQDMNIYSANIQGGSDKSGIFFFLLSNDTAQLKIIRFD
jgi:hypothetical protein